MTSQGLQTFFNKEFWPNQKNYQSWERWEKEDIDLSNMPLFESNQNGKNHYKLKMENHLSLFLQWENK